MSLPRIAFWIEPDDYQAFKAIVLDNDDLPETFDAWLKSTSEDVAKIEAAGRRVEKVLIKPDKFAAWIREDGINADRIALETFAVALSRMNRDNANR